MFAVMQNTGLRPLEQVQEQASSIASRGSRPASLWWTCADDVWDSALESITPERSAIRLSTPRLKGPEAIVQVQEALDYSVQDIGVQHLVLCGHSRCSGLHSAPKTASNSDAHVNPLVRGVMRREKENRDAQSALLQNLRLIADCSTVANAVAAGTLTLHAIFYLAESGVFLRFDEVGSKFVSFD
ncbi:Carbonic anhydrase [Lignipirellula cremea]|uniref:Carbonic anhydrase n=2 Tax=Lignipirellula cremea TaxID=2528010 RepID=A0A518DKJ8_9BACT|nr:Carbonic anhydrase [Lignipirellula cremea]